MFIIFHYHLFLFELVLYYLRDTDGMPEDVSAQ
jgi:hypothetical protein